MSTQNKNAFLENPECPPRTKARFGKIIRRFSAYCILFHSVFERSNRAAVVEDVCADKVTAPAAY